MSLDRKTFVSDGARRPFGRTLVLVRHLLSTAAIVLIGLLATPAHAGWKHLKSADGVSAAISENPKSGLPVIRIRTRIDANIAEVAGVVTDVNNSCKWAGRCLEARVLRSKGDLRHRVYSRRKGPWPISDRDFELDSKVDIQRKGHLVTVRFWSVKKPLIRPKYGVVRLPVMRGHYRLEWAGDNVTNYEFQVEADPGGWIPRWVYRWTAEKGPFESAKNLKRLVPTIKGNYKAFRKRFEAIANPPIRAPKS